MSDRTVTTTAASQDGAGGSGVRSVGPVELSFPVEDDLPVLARLVVSTVASRAGFDIEQVEDLRLAVDELCLLTVRGRREGRLVLVLDADPERIDVWCQYDGVEGAADDAGDEVELSARILEALVDEFGAVTRDGRPGEHLCLRRQSSDA